VTTYVAAPIHCQRFNKGKKGVAWTGWSGKGNRLTLKKIWGGQRGLKSKMARSRKNIERCGTREEKLRKKGGKEALLQ